MDQVNGTSTEYNIPEALRLRGELDLMALQRTISTIAERHEILRTRFGLMDGKPIQIVEPSLEINVAIEDLSPAFSTGGLIALFFAKNWLRSGLNKRRSSSKGL
jgi:hypothetical protein